ncbi:Os04g0609000, partial [Oryza sativa Japonica Group]
MRHPPGAENAVPNRVIGCDMPPEARVVEHPGVGITRPDAAVIHRHCHGATAMRAGLQAIEAIDRHVGALPELPVVRHVAEIPTNVVMAAGAADDAAHHAGELGAFHH